LQHNIATGELFFLKINGTQFRFENSLDRTIPAGTVFSRSFVLWFNYGHLSKNSSHLSKERPETGRPEDEEASRNAIFKDELSADDWNILAQYEKLLEPCFDATNDLEGRPGVKKNLGLIHVQMDIECIVEELTEALQQYGSALTSPLVGEWHFSAQIKLALDKAEEYYDKLDDSTAYLAAIILHPKYKWDYVESQWAKKKEWIDRGKGAVADLWLSTYAEAPLSEAISSPEKDQ
jgi:hypothetical protein